MDCDLTENIAAHLIQRACQQPYAAAVIFPEGRDRFGHVSYTHLTYQQLDQESTRIACALTKYGVQPGDRTVLMVKPGLEFFSLTFALFKLGAIPVLIDPGMGVKNIKRCLDEVEPQIFIGIDKAHLARLMLGWGKKSLRLNITTGLSLRSSLPTLRKLLRNMSDETSFSCHQPQPDETAAILFTSGSTGPPKGAIYTHINFNAQIRALKKLYSIQPGEIDLCTFPLFALFAPALGMTAVIPDMDATRPAQVNPQRIFEAIDNFGVTNMFGSPALLRRVAEQGVRLGKTLPTLKRVISAGAPVPASVLEQFSSMLDEDSQIFTPYGATESLPVCSIGSQTLLGETRYLSDQGKGICVGQPIIDLNIIAIDDDPITQWSDTLALGNGQIGEICVRGPQVTTGYFNRSHSNALSKIPVEDGTFFHRMGDVGYRDGQGRIWFCGRKDHRVVTGAETLFTIPCEAVFNTHEKVFRTALVGIGTKPHQRPVLCVELQQPVGKEQHQRIRDELRQIQKNFPHTKAIEEILFHPRFPVDIRHNAKIFREKLAVWAAKELS
ncbi:MAG: peptide synthase [Desulfuromonas sp.]|nr:MAG: peptide synthase [Desulfuromonas sp.]